jgi:pimeloyl-ACP methyl ester carboxylesterase
LLARRLRVTPLFVRYNTGLHVSQNGEALANLLEALVDAWPGGLEALTLVGYSMGGLVVRSACNVGQLRGDRWLKVVRSAIYLGVPHLGAPLEKLGKTVTATLRKAKNPITTLLADAIDLRSDGVKDLGFGDLRAQDWAKDGVEALLRDPRHPVPLLPGIAHHVVVGAVAAKDRSWVTVLFGDGMVRQTSAAGRRGAKDPSPLFPPESVVVLPGVSHLGLAHTTEVVPHLLAWCRKDPARRRATTAAERRPARTGAPRRR